MELTTREEGVIKGCSGRDGACRSSPSRIAGCCRAAARKYNAPGVRPEYHFAKQRLMLWDDIPPDMQPSYAYDGTTWELCKEDSGSYAAEDGAEDDATEDDGVCVVCNDPDDYPGNDIWLCDGYGCSHQYHTKCLEVEYRPLAGEDESDKWYCPTCRAAAAAAPAPAPAPAPPPPAKRPKGSASATDEGAPWVGTHVRLAGREAVVQSHDELNDTWFVCAVGVAWNDPNAETMGYTDMLDLVDYSTGLRLSPLPGRSGPATFAPPSRLNPTVGRLDMIDQMRHYASTYGAGAEISQEEAEVPFGTCATESPHPTALLSPARVLPSYFTPTLTLTLTTTLTLTITT